MNEEVDFKTLTIKILKFIKDTRIILFITLVVGIAVGIYGYLKSSVYYKSQMLITTNLQYEKSKDFYTKDLVSVYDVLSILQNEIEQKNYTFVKNVIGIQNPVIIKDFNAQIIKTKTGDPGNIIIKIELYNPDDFLLVQNKIIEYCNENEFLKKRFQEQKSVKKNLLSVITVRLNQFDTLYQKMSHNNKNIYLSEDWGGLLNLEYLKQKYENSVSQSNIVEIVHGVSNYPEKIDKRAVKAIAYFVAVMILGFFVAAFVEFVRFVKK